MKRYILNLVSILFCTLVVFNSCKKEQEEIFLNILPNATLSFDKEAGTKSVNIETNASNWSVPTIPVDARSWITRAVREGSLLKVTVTENKSTSRQTVLKVVAEGVTKELKVVQLGSLAEILPNKESIRLSKFATDFTLVVTANVDYDITLPAWITEKSKQSLSDGSGFTHTFSVSQNDSSSRSEYIKITSKNIPIKAEKQVAVTQDGQYAGGDTSSIQGDIKLKIVRGTSTSAHPGEEFEKAFDGNYNTYYHSRYGTGSSPFPVTLELFLDKPEVINYMVYHPRPGGGNGNFGEAEIWVSTEANPTYTKVRDFDFKQSSSATAVPFPSPIIAVKSFKIIVKSGLNGHVSASEIEFYKKNTGAFNPTSIFTDITCSDLKAGITQTDIDAISDPFFKNLALYMFKGEYSKEFRVDEFRAWANPDEIRIKNRMQYSYSNLDNPTGISVNKGEEVVVFVGPTQGRSLQIKVMNLDKPSGDGFTQASFHPIFEGTNKFVAGEKGLMYLQYQASDYESAPKIKIHFASGRVSGYFDKAKHSNDDWNRILAAATDKYFDVVGEKAHLCYETQAFRTHTGSRGRELIDTYDDMVDKTHIFAGTVGQRAMPNRALFHTMYHQFMYCTAYRTAYNFNSSSMAAGLCNPTTFKENVWGPAHEIGHSHQVPPPFKWIGMTEVTVNMNSMNIQTAWGQTTRLEKENRYEKAYNTTIVPKRPFAEAGAEQDGGSADVFCNLVPFWQIYLYFSKVKDDPEFSVKLYEKFRTIPLKSDNNKDGEYQVDFTKSVSELTSTNLIPFFERWGFYKPIDKPITDYVTKQLVVTDTYVNQVKSQIRNLNFPEITDKIEYICDSNWHIFKAQAPVVKGNATRSSNSVTTSGYRNVVAYEVYDNDNLIFVSNRSSFNVGKNFTKVYAISYNGAKTEVTF